MFTFTSAAHGAEQVPFKAAIHTEPEVLGTGPCENDADVCVRLAIPGTGTVSHMGKVSVAGPSFVNVVTGAQTGAFTLTAANGDQLYLRYSGPSKGAGTLEDPASFEGTWVVTGGTGRFDGASGGGTYTGTAAGDRGILYLSGTISSMGASKRR
jgi:hypothetical protein